MFSFSMTSSPAAPKQNGTKPGGDIVTMLLKKRFLSSPFAFGMTISHYRDAEPGGYVNEYDDIFGEGQADEEEGLWGARRGRAAARVQTSDPLSAAAPGQLEKLADWGLSYESRPDSRVDRLLTFLDAVADPTARTGPMSGSWCLPSTPTPSAGCNEYSLSAATPTASAVIEGATLPEDREYIRSQFTADPAEEPVRVLLATDAAGEGIDLPNPLPPIGELRHPV